MENKKHELLSIKNLGNVMLQDLFLLNIDTIEKLKEETNLSLYLKLSNLKNKMQSTKVFDACTAIIHEAKTGEKKDLKIYQKLRIIDMKNNLQDQDS